MREVAYSGVYVPPEWIEAHGFRPVRIEPRCEPGNRFGGMGVCPYAEALANAAAARPTLRALVLSTQCDQIRRMSERIEAATPFPVFLMHAPATWSESGREYYAAELGRLGAFLESRGGEYNPGRLRAFLDGRRPEETPEGAPTVHIGLVGAPLLAAVETIYDTVTAAGGAIVFDATETGLLSVPHMNGAVRADADPAETLANAYFDIPHPFRRPNERFYAWLEGLVRVRGARGLIMNVNTWCDGWAGEIATIKKRTALPLAVLEDDTGDVAASARAVTRIGAMMEMIS